MIETPNTLWKPTANTASHISGRTIADNSRPRCCTNLTISRVVTARSACAAWTSCMAVYLFRRQGVSGSSSPSVSSTLLRWRKPSTGALAATA